MDSADADASFTGQLLQTGLWFMSQDGLEVVQQLRSDFGRSPTVPVVIGFGVSRRKPGHLAVNSRQRICPRLVHGLESPLDLLGSQLYACQHADGNPLFSPNLSHFPARKKHSKLHEIPWNLQLLTVRSTSRHDPKYTS